MLKTVSKPGIKRNFLIFSKDIYRTPAVNVTLNGSRPKAFPLTLRIRQVCQLLPLSFGIALEVLARVTGREKERKRTQIRKEEIKLPTGRQHDGLHRTPKKFTKNS